MNPYWGSGPPKKKGHSYCPKCDKEYNNKWVPEYCVEVNCDGYLGGKRRLPSKDALPDATDAMLITEHIASVRTNRAGHAVRSFVDLQQNKVFKQI